MLSIKVIHKRTFDLYANMPYIYNMFVSLCQVQACEMLVIFERGGGGGILNC